MNMQGPDDREKMYPRIFLALLAVIALLMGVFYAVQGWGLDPERARAVSDLISRLILCGIILAAGPKLLRHWAVSPRDSRILPTALVLWLVAMWGIRSIVRRLGANEEEAATIVNMLSLAIPLAAASITLKRIQTKSK